MSWPESLAAPHKVFKTGLAKPVLGVTGRPSNAAGLSSNEREELVKLRREVRRLQMERDILAKATAWFANKDEKMSTPSSS